MIYLRSFNFGSQCKFVFLSKCASRARGTTIPNDCVFSYSTVVYIIKLKAYLNIEIDFTDGYDFVISRKTHYTCIRLWFKYDYLLIKISKHILCIYDICCLPSRVFIDINIKRIMHNLIRARINRVLIKHLNSILCNLSNEI